ncbi:AraC family transcriptional regulator [Bacillus sp. JCM 19034]|uniref:helix-turn-helix transcriptional regulator n=1 Tax=Bacillus sp. JCM 19034 TaxID=1481928 RepID=UPI000783B980|nr:AraC family transcriptional regulator [Bacillus sp. JCM 19034]
MNKDTLLEDRVHGDPMFAFHIYMVDYLDGDVIFQWHWHHEMEFLVMEEGQALIRVGTSETILQKGEAIFIPSGQLHAAYPVGTHRFRLQAIVFHSQLVNSATYDTLQSNFIDLLLEWEDDEPILIKGTSAFRHIEAILTHYKQKKETYPLLIKGELFLLFSHLFSEFHVQRKTPARTEKSENIARLKQVLTFIDRNLHERLTIKELSSHIQMSEGHFNRFFKSYIKMTPVDYINHVRINKAAKLLKDTNRSVIDISLEVGFENTSYFIRMFKRKKACTPSEFRKKQG